MILRAARLVRRGELNALELHHIGAEPDPEVTAIIPARNEAETIAFVVEECRRYAGQVIVVEGGSTDGTAEVAEAVGARVVRDQGIGKGGALRLAVGHVTTPFCVFIDADGSHDPIDIPMLVAPIKAGTADLVIGSRSLGGSDELHGGADELLRLAGSALITYLINLRYGARSTDTQNGFRAIRTSVFRKLDLRARHGNIEMEMVMATLASGYRIDEVPAHEWPRAAGVSKLSLAKPSTWILFGWCLVVGLCRRRVSQPSERGDR